MPKILRFKIEKKIHLFMLLLLIICVVVVYKFKELKLIDYKQIQQDNVKKVIINKPRLRLFDLNKQPLPAQIYEPIECVESGKFIVTTKLCVHSKEKDAFISSSILGSGIWEGHLMGYKS